MGIFPSEHNDTVTPSLVRFPVLHGCDIGGTSEEETVLQNDYSVFYCMFSEAHRNRLPRMLKLLFLRIDICAFNARALYASFRENPGAKRRKVNKIEVGGTLI